MPHVDDLLTALDRQAALREETRRLITAAQARPHGASALAERLARQLRTALDRMPTHTEPDEFEAPTPPAQAVTPAPPASTAPAAPSKPKRKPRPKPRPEHTEPATCPSCGGAVRPGARFCKHCGTSLQTPEPAEPEPEPARCPACGKNVRPGARFCAHCGVPLSTA